MAALTSSSAQGENKAPLGKSIGGFPGCLPPAQDAHNWYGTAHYNRKILREVYTKELATYISVVRAPAPWIFLSSSNYFLEFGKTKRTVSLQSGEEDKSFYSEDKSFHSEDEEYIKDWEGSAGGYGRVRCEEEK